MDVWYEDHEHMHELNIWVLIGLMEYEYDALLDATDKIKTLKF